MIQSTENALVSEFKTWFGDTKNNDLWRGLVIDVAEAGGDLKKTKEIFLKAASKFADRYFNSDEAKEYAETFKR